MLPVVIAIAAGVLLFTNVLGDPGQGGLLGNVLGANSLQFLLIGLMVFLMMKGGKF